MTLEARDKKTRIDTLAKQSFDLLKQMEKIGFEHHLLRICRRNLAEVKTNLKILSDLQGNV